MEKAKAEKSIISSKDPKSSKSTKESRSEHRRDRETRNEHEGRTERAGRSEHCGRSERKSKDEREEKRERAGYSKHDERSAHGRRREHDERSEHHKKGERESRRDRDKKCECDSKHERSAVESKREHESKSHGANKSERQREGKDEHFNHTKSSRDVEDEKSERKIKDKKVSRDVKEVKRDKGDREDKEYTKTAMQDIKELIMRALECELDGHILEARMLYEESLAKLERCSSEEKNEEISESYRKYLNSYEKHVQRLREHIEQSMFGCKIIEHIAIPKGVRGRSFQKLFGCYLDEKVSLVHIYEPYLTQSSQLEHLINFIEVLVKNCPNLMFVRVITRASPRSDKLQSEVLHDLRDELEGGNISFNYQFDEELKMPRIILNTGVVIRCRRGLHIYKPLSKYYKLGLYDYDFRRCESCEFDVYQGKSFSESISKADRTDLMESLLHS